MKKGTTFYSLLSSGLFLTAEIILYKKHGFEVAIIAGMTLIVVALATIRYNQNNNQK